MNMTLEQRFNQILYVLRKNIKILTEKRHHDKKRIDDETSLMREKKEEDESR